MSLPDGFLELPAQVYGDDPNWVPEDREALAARFSERNPWFASGSARAFCIPGKARAAAFRANDLTVDGEPAAFFGYWESAGDDEANTQVMNAVREWARGAGARRLYGPIDFSTASDNRVRLWDEGGGERPLVDEPYNPPGYPAQLGALGLDVRYRYFRLVLDPEAMRALAADERGALAEAEAAGYRFDRLTPEVWFRRVPELYELANIAFADNFAFVPFTREQFEGHFNEAWAATLHPELSVVVWGPDGDVASCMLAYPDYSPLAVQGAGDARVPLKALNYGDHASLLDPQQAYFKVGVVHPRHQRRAIAHAFMVEGARRALDLGVTAIQGGIIRDDNPSGRVWGRGTEWCERRWYALYAGDV